MDDAWLWTSKVTEWEKKRRYLKSKGKEASQRTPSERTETSYNACQVGEKQAIKGNKAIALIGVTLPQTTRRKHELSHNNCHYGCFTALLLSPVLSHQKKLFNKG